MEWAEYIVKLCQLRDTMRLWDDYGANAGHPVFLALDRARPLMNAADHVFCVNVITTYTEQVESERALSALEVVA